MQLDTLRPRQPASQCTLCVLVDRCVLLCAAPVSPEADRPTEASLADGDPTWLGGKGGERWEGGWREGLGEHLVERAAGPELALDHRVAAGWENGVVDDLGHRGEEGFLLGGSSGTDHRICYRADVTLASWTPSARRMHVSPQRGIYHVTCMYHHGEAIGGSRGFRAHGRHC